MKSNSFEKYSFKDSKVEGLKTFINFSSKNNFKVILHEGTQDIYEQINNPNIVKEFSPLLFSIDINSKNLPTFNSFDQISKINLLDGHHRFEHLKLFNYDLPVPVVLISDNDVTVESYNSNINVDEKQFEEILFENKFSLSNSSEYFLNYKNSHYSNKEITNIYDLYDFKRTLISSEIIIPVQNDISGNENSILNFTPIKLNEFQKENYLFPPKSTWISPRI